MDESSEGGDPFDWSPARLIKEISTLQRSRDAPPARKWPDLGRLAELLEEHEVGGEDLMTYEDVGGPNAFDSLCRDLEIKKIPHKATLHYIIHSFQRFSPQYRRWKDAPGDKQASERTAESAVPTEKVQNDDNVSSKSQPRAHPQPEPIPKAVQATVQSRLGNGDKHDDSHDGSKNTGGTQDTQYLHDLQGSLPDGPPTKRKRVAPTKLAGLPELSTTMRFFLARGQAAGEDGEYGERTWQMSAPGAYLGDWKLPEDAVLPRYDPLNAADYGILQIADFSWASPRPIPAGRRVQVDKIFRRYLRPQRSSLNVGRRVDTGRSKIYSARFGRGPNGSRIDDDDLVVLPLLGESDDDVEYDSETWEEMEAEARERDNPNAKPGKDTSLSADAVNAAMDEAIGEIEAKWTTRKLPKLQREMHSLWTQARRLGSLKAYAEAELRTVEKMDRRIADIRKGILAEEWKSEAPIRRQASNLEASIEDRQRARWKAKLYASPIQPEKPKTTRAARPNPFARRAIHARLADDGDEVLTSSSEEEEDENADVSKSTGNNLKDFIVDEDDDEGSLFVKKQDTKTATLAGDPMQLDPIPVEPPRPAEKAPAAREDSRVKELPPLEDLDAIAEKGADFWAEQSDMQRLQCSVLLQYDGMLLVELFSHMSENDTSIWQNFCLPIIQDEPSSMLAKAITRLFFIFVTCSYISADAFSDMDRQQRRSDLEKNRGRVGQFCVHMRILQPYFASRLPQLSPDPEPAKTGERRNSPVEDGPEVIQLVSSDDEEEEDEFDDVIAISSQDALAVVELEDEDDDDIQPSPSRGRRRKILMDKHAKALRDKDRQFKQDIERRRAANRRRLLHSATIDRDRSRLIINDAREEHQSPVYISPEIGMLIRDHQIEGVRFMWNRLMVPEPERQGCLLAHTMGLGKTMQVITLLVAIAEAAQSPSANVVAQVPEDLRESKTLILCPSGLVENWRDELSCWTPPDLLGIHYSVTSDMQLEDRLTTVQRWADQGGVLVLGYPMLKKLLETYPDELVELLEQGPHIVVADEAHALKNPKSKLHMATANFATKARIAMTGSPLANSVEEYHSMINWVAPNYLSDHREFAQRFATPIRKGFYRDSKPHQRRQALTRLKALKEMVAPKIHRATVAMLKGELPPKREYILYLPITELQQLVYRHFVAYLRDPGAEHEIGNTVQLWNLMYNLVLLLAHPKAFKLRLDEMKEALAAESRSGFGGPIYNGYSHIGHNGQPSATVTLPRRIVSELLSLVNKRDVDSILHSSKVMVLMAILDEAHKVGDKVLVFSQSKLVLDYLEHMFKLQKRRFSRLDGGTAVTRRQGDVKNFNTSHDEVYLISTTAGGVGLNIHGANRVVIFDFRWNPVHEQQAIGRTYRIGQRKPVFVYWLLTGGTFETVLHDQAVFKTQLASRVVDDEKPQAWADQIRNYTVEPTVMPVDAPELRHRFRGQDDVLDALLAAEANLSQRICKIVSTDTFEEEEPEENLSPDEIREAHKMAETMRYQQQHPNQPQTQSLNQNLHQHSHSSHGSPVSTPVLPSAQMMPMSIPSSAPPTLASLLSSSPPPSLPALRGGTIDSRSRPSSGLKPPTLPLFGQPSTPAAPSHHPRYAPSQASPQAPPVPLGLPQAPILIPTEVNKGGPYQSIATAETTRRVDPSLESLNQLEDALHTQLMSGNIPSRLGISDVSARGQAHKLICDLRENCPMSGLPALSLWIRLLKLVERDSVFANAMITRRIPIKTLATMSSIDEGHILADLHQNDDSESSRSGVDSVNANNADKTDKTDNAIQPSQVKSDVGQPDAPRGPATDRRRDPDHIRFHLRRSMDKNHQSRQRTSKSRGDGQGSRDMMVMREVIDRRKGKRTTTAGEAQRSSWSWTAPSTAAHDTTTRTNTAETAAKKVDGLTWSLPLAGDPGSSRQVGNRTTEAERKRAGDDQHNPCVLD